MQKGLGGIQVKGKIKWIILGIIIIAIIVASILIVNEKKFAYEIEEIKELKLEYD